jgi:hypothetical protein
MKTTFYVFILFFTACFAQPNVFAQQLDAERLVAACMPAVVCISTPDGSGSGFVVEKSGYIVTNFHVISNENDYPNYAYDIEIEFKNGKTFKCLEVVRTDPKHDLALLRITSGDYPTLPIYNSLVKTGADVGALGCPLGLKFNFTKGSVSNADFGQQEYGLSHIIQTTIPINPGNSGGAVVNKNGQVVAVVVAKDMRAEGINFAIKSTVLINFLNKESIKFTTAPLISNEELKTETRKLTAEEEAKAKSTNLNAMENEDKVDNANTDAKINVISEAVKTITIAEEEERKTIAKKAADDRLEADVKAKNKLYLEAMSAEQRKALLTQVAAQESELSAVQHKWSIESIEDQGKRKKMRLDQDILTQNQAEHKYKKDMIAYRAGLAQRFSTRIGFGAIYYIGTLGVSNTSAFDTENIGLAGEATFAYRLDRKGNNRRSRATSIGGGLKFGAWNSPVMSKIITAQNWNSNFANLRNEHLFLELSGGFLLREWFKIDGGYGQQYIYANNDIYIKNYGIMTLGFIARFGAVELEATASGLFLANFEKPTLRANLQLVYHAKWGKF